MQVRWVQPGVGRSPAQQPAQSGVSGSVRWLAGPGGGTAPQWHVPNGSPGVDFTFRYIDTSPEHPFDNVLERKKIEEEYGKLAVWLNDKISDYAAQYGVTKAKVFDLLQQLSPYGSGGEIATPWCVSRGGKYPCGYPPAYSATPPPCCAEWWPEDCTPGGLVAFPYRPRPECGTNVVREASNGVYQMGWASYNQGLAFYAAWKKKVESRLPALETLLKKVPADDAGKVDAHGCTKSEYWSNGQCKPRGRPPLLGKRVCWPDPVPPDAAVFDRPWVVQLWQADGSGWKWIDHNEADDVDAVHALVSSMLGVKSVVYVYQRTSSSTQLMARFASSDVVAKLEDCTTTPPPGLPSGEGGAPCTGGKVRNSSNVCACPTGTHESPDGLQCLDDVTNQPVDTTFSGGGRAGGGLLALGLVALGVAIVAVAISRGGTVAVT